MNGLSGCAWIAPSSLVLVVGHLCSLFAAGKPGPAHECALPRSSAAMVRVWMLRDWLWPRWQRMCQGDAIKARCGRSQRVEFAACC
jgi:hypothetical protein